MSNSFVQQMRNSEEEQLQSYKEVYSHYMLSTDIEKTLFFLDVITPTLYFPVIITNEHDEPLQDYLSFTLNLDSSLHQLSTIELQRDFLLEKIAL